MEYEKSPDNIFYGMMLKYARGRWYYFDDLLHQVGRYSINSEELTSLAEKYYKKYTEYNVLWIQHDTDDIISFSRKKFNEV